MHIDTTGVKRSQVAGKLASFFKRFGGGSKPPKSPSSATHDLRVREVVRETADAVSLRFDHPAAGNIDFRPGQYFTVTLQIDDKKIRRSYSVSSALGDDHLALTVKRVGDGAASSYINAHVKAGDVLRVTGPTGNFHVEPARASGHDLVLIAGGSGITPMMSITDTLLRGTAPCNLALIYGNRSAADVIFSERLGTLATKHPERFRLRQVLQTPHADFRGASGVLDEATLAAEIAAIAPSNTAEFFICGPTPVLDAGQAVLSRLGVEPTRIFVERFTAAVDANASSYAPQKLVVRGGTEIFGTVMVEPGRTLLDAGLDADLPMPFTCTGGNCGDCKVRLLSGSVDIAEPNCLRKVDREAGYILTCSSHPKTDVEIDVDDRGADY
ncbi:MAG: ferredoxin--NADP reductase [Clostridia bacterium]|nr:ferredoxin--NADP reductase [Deltaproteobacteria bacterium]